MKRVFKLSLLVVMLMLGVTSCTMNDDELFLEETFVSDTEKEDGDPPIEDPNGE